jgi:hypothetical protein
MNKKLASALAGVGLLGASLGVSQVAFAQESPDTGPDAVASAFQEAETDAQDGEGRHHHGGRHGHRGHSLEAAAEAIGITSDELRTGLEAGQSVADVAEANGVSADAVVEALINQASERIDAKVAEGKITADEGADKLAEKIDRIQEKVFSVRGGDDPQA